MVKREAVNEAEVVSLVGGNVVTLIINGQFFTMSAEVAKAIASDLRMAAVRIGRTS